MVVGRPSSAPPGARQPGLGTSKSVQFESSGSQRSGKQRPGSAVGRSASSSLLVAPSQAAARPLQVHAGNTRIRQHRTQSRPGTPIDWSRQWITAPPKVRRRPPVPVPRPESATVLRRSQVSERALSASFHAPYHTRQQRVALKLRVHVLLLLQQVVRTAPKVRVIRFSQTHPESESSGSLQRSKLRRAALEAKKRAVTYNQDCILVIHGRLVGRDVQRPAMQYAPLLSQLMALSPPKMPSTALLLECHEFWPSIASEPKSLALGMLGEAMVEAVSKQVRKFKKVTVIAHSLGAWLLYKVLASLQENKPALMRKLQRVVLISPVASHPWLSQGIEPRVLSSVPCTLLSGSNDKLVPTWYVEAAVRPWFPNVKPLELLDGGNHLGCLLPSAGDLWDRRMSGSQRLAYQEKVAALLAEALGWNSETEAATADMGNLLLKPTATLSQQLQEQHGCTIETIEQTMDAWVGCSVRAFTVGQKKWKKSSKTVELIISGALLVVRDQGNAEAGAKHVEDLLTLRWLGDSPVVELAPDEKAMTLSWTAPGDRKPSTVEFQRFAGLRGCELAEITEAVTHFGKERKKALVNLVMKMEASAEAAVRQERRHGSRLKIIDESEKGLPVDLSDEFRAMCKTTC